jgi:hypothetical protein
MPAISIELVPTNGFSFTPAAEHLWVIYLVLCLYGCENNANHTYFLFRRCLILLAFYGFE